MNSMVISGSKGAAKQHTPVESPDSLINTSYANILDGVSEGPIVGLVDGARSIYLDQTPLAGADGTMNFTGVTWEQRYGEHDQDYIPGFPSVESEHSVGVELKATQPWTQAISNLQLSAVRVRLGASALYQQSNDGDTTGFTVAYVIELSTDGSDYKTVVNTAFSGKTTTGYQRSHRIDLPAAEEGWSLRVRRTTLDQTDSKIGDTTTVVSYTEVIDAKLQYPYTALVGIKIDASQFNSIPERAFRIKGRIIQVPSNYEPSTRSYTGTWDGTFKLAWTDCPPWIYRDLLLNDRYGLGRFISDRNVDKWELYQIAQYCDQLVSDGQGGQEPRFTCNLYLQSRADALQVLQDLASIFRGMAYYAGDQVIASADMPQDPVYTYTNANVIDGKFTRVGSSGSTRYSVAKVSWTDRENFGAQRVEYVQNQQSIARYGIRETEITAFGCVSQGQAQRLGQYTLLTNQLETGTIQFSVGLDGVMARPGQVIRVADEKFAGKPIGGRVKSSTASSITVDDDLSVAAGDTLVIIQPNGTAQTRIIKAVTGRVLTVTQAFTTAPVAESVYAIETAEVVPEAYRILTITENFGDDKLQYDIVAVQHNASKFAAIDSGAQIVTPPTTTLPNAVQAMPANVAVDTFDAVKQGLTVATMRITWDAAKGAQSYNVWWKRDSGDWIYAGVTFTNSIEVSGIYTGSYTARVSAVGVNGNASLWAYSAATQLYGKTGQPPALASFSTVSEVFGIRLSWAFPPGAEDTLYTEVQESATSDGASATQLGLVSYPAVTFLKSGMAAGVTRFFRARLGDRSGNTGAWTSWVMGQSSSEGGEILTYLAGRIDETELAQGLKDRITSIEEQVASLDGLSAYKPDATYTAGEMVVQGGRIYQATQAVPANTPPPNTSYWLDVGQVVQSANGLAQQVQKNTTSITDLAAETGSLQVLRAAFRDDTGEGDLQDALKLWDTQAAYSKEVVARATQNQALVQTTETLQAQAGQNTASIQTVSKAQASTDGKLSVMWSMKFQVNSAGQYVYAGIGAGIENGPGGLQSTLLFTANQIAFANPTTAGAVDYPFIIKNGQNFLGSTFIENASVSFLKIGDDVQSTNYVAGQTGWRLAKDGTFEINGNIAGLGKLQLNNSALRIFHPNGVEAIYLGL